MTECTFRPDCSGCPHFETSFEGWRQLQRTRVDETRAPYSFRFEIDWIAAPKRQQYRARTRMVVKGTELGFYQEGSREVLPVSKCVVHYARLESALDVVRKFLENFATSNITHVDARAGDKTVVTFCVSSDVGMRDAIESFDWGDIDVHLNVGSSDAIMSGAQVPVIGDEHIHWNYNGEKFVAKPQAFFQVNPTVLQQIHKFVRPAFEGKNHVLDLYCGVGIHGLSLAGDATITGFDSSIESISSAQQNSNDRSRNDTWTAISDSEFEIPEADIAIVNPGRRGISRTLTEKIVERGPQQLVYISCGPTTFFRDLERLYAMYEVVRVGAFEMMPRTDHVELVAVLKRKAPAEEIPKKSESTKKTWVARVVGRSPKGTPPGGLNIKVEKIRRLESSTIVRIKTDGVDAETLCQALRKWGFPILGDEVHGDRSENRKFRRTMDLDQPVLHDLSKGPIPAFLLQFFQLPRRLLEN